MEPISETVKRVMLMIQKKAHDSNHLDDMEQICFRCGAVCMGEDMSDDHPCDSYYCECGNSWIDTDGWVNRYQGAADMARKAQLEGG